MTPTNLTDEGLREIAQNIADAAICHLRHMYPYTYNTRPKTAMVSLKGLVHNHTFTALKQIRDAAKKEERERCAKLAEDYGNSLIGIIKTSAKSNTPYHLKSQGTAKGAAIGAERIATAIRQSGGGK